MGRLEKMRAAWRAHKHSFLISFLLTLAGLGLYYHTYIAEKRTPLAQFIDSLEVRTYDTRFRVRGRTPPRPEIVIVAIDQATLERLGSWPFSRLEYARLLDNLTADGARVIGLDINFPKPDTKSGLQAVQQAREEYLARTPVGRRDPAYLATLAEMEQQADADARFAEAIRRAGNVVLGYFFFPSKAEVRFIDRAAQQKADGLLAFSSYSTRGVSDAQGNPPPPLKDIFHGEEDYLAETNLPLFTEAADFSVGYFNFVADADGVFRRSPLTVAYRSAWQEGGEGELNFYPALDIQVLRRFLNIPEHETVLLYNKAGVEAVQLGDRRIPTDPEGRLLIHYQGGPFTYPHISLSDVVEERFRPGTFRDKIVLVGPTALAIGDFGPTPFAESFHAGVEIHANVLDTILSQRFIHRGDREKMIDLGLILIFGLGVGALLATLRPSWTTPVTVALVATFLGLTYVALAQFQLWLNLVVPGTVLVTNFAGVTAFRVLLEEREKRKVRAAFQQYVPPGVIRELMKNPERLTLGGEERELTIMFSDIRGFTTLSERLTPLELTSFLNAYTDEMTDIIFRHWGTLDKFEGDAIMAFWGAPYEQDDHVLRACAAALEMSRRMDALRQQWREEGKPDINIGLGLNTGRVVVGNMGSRKRFNYTVLGDPVNLASRLEGVNKEYATRILVSEFTYQQAADPLSILERRLCRQFSLSPEALANPDDSAAAKRARQLALYVGHTQRLASDAALAERYGGNTEAPVEQTVAQVEQQLARSKRLSRLVAEARRSLSPLLFRQLDWIRVKGRSEPVALYELLGEAEEASRYAELLELFDTGLRAYRGQQWEAAVEIFESILQHYPDDGPARLLAARCRQYEQQPPPADWDGVFVMKTK
ncbi:MAG TPA: adenylate/guanylate cyclase domain-containing protein [Candidatus Acidoferrales bacterium]|nr:adenylate/guanylate cyclase domain-containing protein [Candidatus Acidoferrales bacterium]